MKNLLETNEGVARQNRQVLREYKIFTVNLLGSPARKDLTSEQLWEC